MVHFKFLQLVAICTVVGLATTPVLAENLTLTVNTNEYEIVEKKDGQQTIKMEDFGSLFVPGKPKLPAKTFMIALPPGAEVVSVTVNGIGPTELPGTFKIRPAPPILPMDNEKELIEEFMREWEENKEITYSSDQIYPEEIVEYLGTGGLRKYTFARVRFCPFAYRPLSGKLLFHSSTKVSIDYVLPSPGSPEAHEAERLLMDVKGEEQASRWLINYSEAKTWYTATAKRSTPSETYDYVIITTDALESSVTPLVTWKRAIGYSVNVVTTTWISANYPGIELPVQMKNFLIDKYPEWGIEYVILVGDIEDVPMKMCSPKPDDHNEDTPTDHYYADLSGDWNADGDEYYGEYEGDDVDLAPEVYVGRIPWSDPAIVNSICQKLVNFESDTGQWKNAALLLGAYYGVTNECENGRNSTCGGRLMEHIITDMLDGWTYHTLYEKEGLEPCPTPCTAPLTNSNVVSYWSSGQYGIVNWFGHGSCCAAKRKWWEWDDGDGIPENANCSDNDEMDVEPFIQNLDHYLLNDDYPSLIFSCSCNNAHTEYHNLAKVLLEQGSAGIVAATRVTYIVGGWWDETWVGNASVDYYFFHYLISQKEKIGNALFDSKLYNANNLNWNSWPDFKQMYSFNLFGDPSLIREGVEVYPDIQLSSASYDFGDVFLGQSQNWTFTISNVGPVDLLVNSIEFNNPDFEVKEISRRYAYVTEQESGLVIIDVADPSLPSLIEVFEIPSPGGVIVADACAYVTGGVGGQSVECGLYIINISDPTSPSSVGSCTAPGCASGLMVAGNYAYLAAGSYGLHIVDISDPASPSLIGNYDTPGSACDVDVVGDYAYVADGAANALQIVDVSDPTSPFLKGSYSYHHNFIGVAVGEDYAYVANYFIGLTVVDVSDPTSPFKAGSYNTPGYSMDVTIVDDYAFVADYDCGLQIIDISDPTSPFLVGSYDTPGYAFVVSIYGNHAYVADSDGGLQIIDVSDPTSPTLAGSYETTSSVGGVAVAMGSFPQTIEYEGSLNVTVAFAPSSRGNISGQMTVRSDDPDSPVITGSLQGKGFAPDIRITPASFDETVMEDDVLIKDLTIANHGNYELTFQITEAMDWLEVIPSSGVIDPEGEQSVEVTIDATSISQGDYEEEMIITSNDPFNPEVSIPIALRVEAARVIVAVPTSSALPGEVVRVPIEMDNLAWLSEPISGVEMEVGFDHNLLTLVDVTPTDRTQSMGSFQWSSPGPGMMALSIGDAAGNAIEPGTGPVAEMSFDVSDAATPGNCTEISISQINLFDEQGETVVVEPMDGIICFGLKGDINADSQVDIIDALLAVNILLQITTPTDVEYWAADCNGDGIVNIFDVLGIVNVVLGIGECIPGVCKSEVTPEAMEFIASLESYFAPVDFDRLMTLVRQVRSQVAGVVPTQYYLGQNYPNPFNPTTTIQYQIPEARSKMQDARNDILSHTTLKIFNLLGQEVRTLVDKAQEPGYYTVTWDGKDSDGGQAASGIYFYRLSVAGPKDSGPLRSAQWSATKKMVLMK